MYIYINIICRILITCGFLPLFHTLPSSIPVPRSFPSARSPRSSSFISFSTTSEKALPSAPAGMAMTAAPMTWRWKSVALTLVYSSHSNVVLIWWLYSIYIYNQYIYYIILHNYIIYICAYAMCMCLHIDDI